MTWTKVLKPTTSTWTTASGKYTAYNDPNVTYDQSTIYYDGANPNAWSKVSKPITSSWTSVPKPV